MIAGIIALGVLVFSGIKILTSPDQPSVISDARTKIVGAFIGIVILLSSYLILTTINPQLSIITLSRVEPTTGIYLTWTDANGNQTTQYLVQDTPNVDFNGKTIKFLSSKEELTAIFVYTGENYTGTDSIVENGGPGTTAGDSGKSVVFLWNKPGIYLYPQLNLKGRPRYYFSSVSSLSADGFDNIASSLELNRGSDYSKAYGVVLFTENGYRGECGLTTSDKIENLSNKSDTYFNPIGPGTLSSFQLFDYGGKNPGYINFYDRINCEGNKKAVKMNIGFERANSLRTVMFDGTQISVDEKILSFSIDGNYAVVLTTGKDFTGRCQVFTRPPLDNCISSLKGEHVFDPEIDGARVKSYIIYPLPK
jgi:hypothetical protein